MLGERSILVRADPVVLFVDPPKIERIVENLVMNGVRQTPAEVAIWVKLWPQDGGAVIALEDDGPGVPNSIRGEIFEPFRQGPPRPHTPRAPGSACRSWRCSPSCTAGGPGSRTVRVAAPRSAWRRRRRRVP